MSFVTRVLTGDDRPAASPDHRKFSAWSFTDLASSYDGFAPVTPAYIKMYTTWINGHL
jgi:hypothetical protein